MVRCIVPCCRNRGTISGISYHKIPPGMSDVWFRLLNLNKETNSSLHNTVCSIHFKTDDFKFNARFPQIKPDTIPSLYLDRPMTDIESDSDSSSLSDSESDTTISTSSSINNQTSDEEPKRILRSNKNKIVKKKKSVPKSKSPIIVPSVIKPQVGISTNFESLPPAILQKINKNTPQKIIVNDVPIKSQTENTTRAPLPQAQVAVPLINGVPNCSPEMAAQIVNAIHPMVVKENNVPMMYYVQLVNAPDIKNVIQSHDPKKIISLPSNNDEEGELVSRETVSLIADMHNYSSSFSHVKDQNEFKDMKEQINELKKKYRHSKQTERRLMKQIGRLKGLVEEIKQNRHT